MRKTPRMSVGDLQRTASEMVSNGLILSPDLPAESLAGNIVDEADEEFSDEFGRSLMIAFFTRSIRIARRKQKRATRPEGYELLPLYFKVPGKEAKVRFDKLTFWDAQLFYWSMARGLDEKKKDNPKLLQSKALVETLKKAAKKAKGITAGEVLSFDFGS